MDLEELNVECCPPDSVDRKLDAVEVGKAVV